MSEEESDGLQPKTTQMMKPDGADRRELQIRRIQIQSGIDNRTQNLAYAAFQAQIRLIRILLSKVYSLFLLAVTDVAQHDPFPCQTRAFSLSPSSPLPHQMIPMDSCHGFMSWIDAMS
ncbi:hypothetical protein ACQ4M4_27475 [Leptolyngbya sp. AN02str]|uniref:hypothetical protein n=1 Tax=Leptolyngbya sp. AN02str TaxID=3423363 RepID=UPI003D317F4B